jgi:hypothetical protein
MSISEKLEIPFPPSAVSWRVGRKTKDGKKATLLAYIDARDVMQRLDDALGFENWQCKYSLSDNGLLVCDIGLRINGEWLWRANGAGDTQVEAEKGKCSDAFKRAAVVWGVGRYLYGLDTPWVEIDQYGKWTADPKLPEWATPKGFLDAAEAKRKAEHDATFFRFHASVIAVKQAIDAEDGYTVRECWDEIPEDAKRALWIAPTKGGCLTTAERDYIKNKMPAKEKAA